MIIPNLPLFITENDEIVLKSKIVNTGKEKITGKAIIELSDAESGNILPVQQEIPIVLFPGSQKEAAWKFTVPSVSPSIKKLCVIIKFKADKPVNGRMFSDGEKRIIEVIPELKKITETSTFVLDGEHGKDFYQRQLLNKIQVTAQHITTTNSI